MRATTIHPLRRLRRRLGVAVIGAALLSTNGCGGNIASNAAELTVMTPTTSATPMTTTPTTITEATSSTTVANAARPTTTVDEMVGREGERVHVRCTGSGAATVLLIAGFGAGSDGWGEVEPAISARTRVCSYDRLGTGTSDPAVGTQTFVTQATSLHALLAMIGEPGPYVVVGHSFGGAEAVTFASEFTDEIIGLVLVDASPVSWPEAICAVADDGSDAAAIPRNLCSGWSDPSDNAEHLDVFAAFAGVSSITALDSLSMSVITAVDRELPVGLAPSEVARLTDVWDRGQHQWSQLSTAGRVVSVRDTSHAIQLDHPDLVVDEVALLLP